MPTLVTGGAGYIGSHTVRQLRQRGEDVVVLDNMEFGHRDSVADTPLVVGDIADSDLVSHTLTSYRIDAIVHFAAYKAAGESFEDPGRYFTNNVGGSARLIETAHRHGVRRFVFSSTCAVYGTPDQTPVSEAAPIHPESPYGESKAMVERLLQWYDTCHGMRSVSLRYFNAAGAAMDGSLGEDWSVTLNLIPVAMKALLGKAPPLRVFGTDYPTPDGTAIRDYIHVDDLADAHLRSLDYLTEGGGHHGPQPRHRSRVLGAPGSRRGGGGGGPAGPLPGCPAPGGRPHRPVRRQHGGSQGARLGTPVRTGRNRHVGLAVAFDDGRLSPESGPNVVPTPAG